MYTVTLTSHIQEDATWQTKQNKRPNVGWLGVDFKLLMVC